LHEPDGRDLTSAQVRLLFHLHDNPGWHHVVDLRLLKKLGDRDWKEVGSLVKRNLAEFSPTLDAVTCTQGGSDVAMELRRRGFIAAINTSVKPEQSELVKLVSAKGEVLGTVTIPIDWLQEIRERWHYHFRFADFIKVTSYPAFNAGPTGVIKMGVLHQSHDIRGALELTGLTLEEFEQVPGCTFQPGAAYLKSLIG
jgi:hypothetical protein